MFDELEYSLFDVHFRQSVHEDVPEAYLFNFKPFEIDDEKGQPRAALLLYFLAQTEAGAGLQ